MGTADLLDESGNVYYTNDCFKKPSNSKSLTIVIVVMSCLLFISYGVLMGMYPDQGSKLWGSLDTTGIFSYIISSVIAIVCMTYIVARLLFFKPQPKNVYNMSWKKGQKIYCIFFFFLLFFSMLWIPSSISYINNDLNLGLVRFILYAVVLCGIGIVVLLTGTCNMKKDPWTWLCMTYFLFHVWIVDATLWPNYLN